VAAWQCMQCGYTGDVFGFFFESYAISPRGWNMEMETETKLYILCPACRAKALAPDPERFMTNPGPYLGLTLYQEDKETPATPGCGVLLAPEQGVIDARSDV